MTWTTSALLGFDTETTGVDTASDRIVSAALVRRTPGDCGVTTVQTWLIDPGVEIPDAAAQIHGITTARVRAEGVAPAPALEEIAGAITAALHAGAPVVAFNACFDLALLEAELRRHGLPTLQDRLGGPVRPVIDPLVLDRAVDRYRKGKRTLSDLMALYGVSSPDAMHAADVDTVATLDVVRAMARKYPAVAQLEAEQLHDYQVEAHRRWAQSFNEWLIQRGRRGDVSLEWPLPL